MNNQRYQKMIRYKIALDTEWKRRNPYGISEQDYDNTLYQVKFDGFKVLRNENGEHKLIDTVKEGEESNAELFNMMFGGLFKGN